MHICIHQALVTVNDFPLFNKYDRNLSGPVSHVRR